MIGRDPVYGRPFRVDTDSDGTLGRTDRSERPLGEHPRPVGNLHGVYIFAVTGHLNITARIVVPDAAFRPHGNGEHDRNRPVGLLILGRQLQIEKPHVTFALHLLRNENSFRLRAFNRRETVVERGVADV